MRQPRRGTVIVALCAVMAAVAGEPVCAQQSADAAAAYSADDVKAAFLYNFLSYVQWPSGSAGPATPITFALLNAPSVERALQRVTEDRTVQGRTIRVRRLRSINELSGEEVVFIGAAENWRLQQLIAAIGGPTLIVTDAPDGLAAGSMINFQLVDQRVRFEIALPTAEAAGLTLSSRLLSAALRVETSRCWLACWEPVQPVPVPSFAAGLTAWRHDASSRRRVSL